MKILLVVECTGSLNWYKTFEGVKIEGEPIQIEQAEWNDISAVSYGKTGVMVSMKRANKPLPGTSQERERTVKVDFVLLRSVSRGTWTQDSRNLLFTLIHSNVPSVNTLHSAFMCLEKPAVYGALLGIQQRLGYKAFPLIEQYMYPSYKEMLMTPDYPVVVKMGTTHAGYGKMKITDSTDFRDFAGCVALTPHYVTAEKFIDWDWDGRVQKIGDHYRVFKRQSMNWKGNVGNMSILESIELTDEFRTWADECASLFGGIDILGLDFVHCKTNDKYYILELNDTAIGLVHEHEDEDMGHMRDLVVAKMEQLFVQKLESPRKSKRKEIATLKERLRVAELEAERERSQRAVLTEKIKALEKEKPSKGKSK